MERFSRLSHKPKGTGRAKPSCTIPEKHSIKGRRKKMNYYAAYIDAKGQEYGMLFDSETINRYYNVTFSPETKEVAFITFNVSGKNYQERKENVRQKAIEFSNFNFPGLFFSDMIWIENWFRKQAERYGLLEEFRENAII
jgi:hypothetical protein